jgi:hypothetical protein
METAILAAFGVTALVASAFLAIRATRRRASHLQAVPEPHEIPRLRLLRSDEEVQEALDRAMESERAAARVSELRAQHYSLLRAQLRPTAGESQLSRRSPNA